MTDQAWASWMSNGTRAAYDAAPSTRYDWSKVSVTVDGSSAVKRVCASGITLLFCLGANGAAHAVAHAVEFTVDPMGWLDSRAAVALCTRADLEEAHARMADRGQWVLNEKGLLARAGLHPT